MSPNNEIATSRWQGRNAIILLRCGIANPAKNSIPAQREVLASFANQNGITIIKEYGGQS